MKSLARIKPSSSKICSYTPYISTTAALRNDVLNLDQESIRPPLPSTLSRYTPVAPRAGTSKSGSPDDTLLAQMKEILHFATPAAKPSEEASMDLPASLAESSAFALKMDMQRQLPRQWHPGDVYAPKDLGPREAAKWAKLRQRPERDTLDMLGKKFNPLNAYKVRWSSVVATHLIP